MELECVGYMAFGRIDDQRIALCEYTGPTELAVKGKILDVARREGYKGTVDGRMLELGWWIEPVYALPRNGYCLRGEHCNCGGDLSAVRAGCANWVTPNAELTGIARNGGSSDQ